jgi:hypothetical protein
MNISEHFYFEAGGFEFETELVDYFTMYAKREWGNGAVKFSTERQDRHEGTDLFVLGIPIDFTLAFATKNKIYKLDVMELDGVTIEFGIRFGNGKAVFKTPVLVIGAEAAIGITKSNMWVTLDIIKSNIPKILDKGMDDYLLAIEA